MSINKVSLADPTDPARPHVKTLEISVVGDLAFVEICTLDEGNPTTTSTVIAEMAVSPASLRDALALLCEDRDRESLRPVDERGEPMPSYAGTRTVVVTA